MNGYLPEERPLEGIQGVLNRNYGSTHLLVREMYSRVFNFFYTTQLTVILIKNETCLSALKIPFPFGDLLCEFRDSFPPLSFGPHKPYLGFLLLECQFPHEPVIIFQPG